MDSNSVRGHPPATADRMGRGWHLPGGHRQGDRRAGDHPPPALRHLRAEHPGVGTGNASPGARRRSTSSGPAGAVTAIPALIADVQTGNTYWDYVEENIFNRC